MQLADVFDVPAEDLLFHRVLAHEVVGHEEEAAAVEAARVAGDDRSQLGHRARRRVTPQQEVEHRHHRGLAGAEAGVQVGRFRAPVRQRGRHQRERPVEANGQLVGHHVVLHGALRLLYRSGQADHEVRLVDLFWDFDELGEQRHAGRTSAIGTALANRASVVKSGAPRREASST